MLHGARYHVPEWDAKTEGLTPTAGSLTQELEAVASEHVEELSAAIPGFGAALAWPETVPA